MLPEVIKHQTPTTNATMQSPSRRSTLKKQPSRIDLERERNMIEQQMSRLEKSRSTRKLILQRERIKVLQRDSITTANTQSLFNGSDVDSTDSTSSPNCKHQQQRSCTTCCRKDRIIARQRHEIESLRQQLLEMQTTTQQQAVPLHLVCDDDATSMISGVTLGARHDLQDLEDSFRKP
mmetsp:Transcript_5452/g.8964  ORF Transcript_5452/g.8964 Transcript_5452/m.8964 type:complete len:178 (+) Transcript_5452:35-568(+)